MIYRVPTAWGLTKGRYSTPPLYSSSDLIPIFTWASSVYYTHDKLPFKKKKKKKKTGLCWCWHFCGEDSHDFIHGVKLGLLFCWNLCKAKKVRFDHCRSNIVLVKLWQMISSAIVREVVLPLSSRVSGSVPEQCCPCLPFGFALASFIPCPSSLDVSITCKTLLDLKLMKWPQKGILRTDCWVKWPSLWRTIIFLTLLLYGQRRISGTCWGSWKYNKTE